MQYLVIAASFIISLLTSIVYNRLQQRKLEKELEINMIISRLRNEISNLITELNSTTDRNIALLESRIQAAQSLSEKAAKVQKVLKTENEKNDSVEKIYSELARQRPLKIEITEKEADNVRDFDRQPVREKALVLYRRGMSADKIAGELEMSRGEVELIISLYEKMPRD